MIEMLFLLRTPGGDIVARTSPMDLIDGNEASYELVAELPIDTHLSHLRSDDPKLQTLLCKVFVEGALWVQQNSDKTVKRWKSVADRWKEDTESE
jgi:hypothetical protein